jgi:hypothetical protein
MSEHAQQWRLTGGTERWVRIGQWVLNVSLLLTGVWLASHGSRRALFLLVMVPLVFVPFSYSRTRLHRFLGAHLGSSTMWVVTAMGLTFDAIMVGQLLSSRSTLGGSALQAPVATWIGPVWFSAHALLLLGYGFMGAGRLLTQVIRRLGSRTPTALPIDETLIGRRELLQKASLFGASAFRAFAVERSALVRLPS